MRHSASLLPWLVIACSMCFGLPITPFFAFSASCESSSTTAPAPLRLSQTCLYSDSKQQRVSSQLKVFTPNYQLWSDGALKTRWIYLPAASKIDSSDPDRWIFPVGTQIFKQFSKADPSSAAAEIRVETRHLFKISAGHGEDSWRIATYAWQGDQKDALLSAGAKNVLGTNHNIPDQKECVMCHKGNADFILGFEAIQLSDSQASNAFGYGRKRQAGEITLQSLLDEHSLTHAMPQPRLPGTELEQKVLGYLHANCGNCHNPLGHAAEQEAEHLKMRHWLKFDSVELTDVYQTAVNQTTKNFTYSPYIVMGAQNEELALFNSALILRMLATDEDYRMPPVARTTVDHQALELLHQWLLTLPTPAGFEFERDKYAVKPQLPQTANTSNTDSASISTAREVGSEWALQPGLNMEVQFFDPEQIPPVMIAYWPEDDSLADDAVMDHADGYFTEKLIVGRQGSEMILRNSDDVGHTIYVKDEAQQVNWRLNYMPPNSQFRQKLFWDEDKFVEMRCKLHLYMSAWAGSITSRYHQIFEFPEEKAQHRLLMTDFPPHFTQLKVWLPKIQAISIEIKDKENTTIPLLKGKQVVGQLKLFRVGVTN